MHIAIKQRDYILDSKIGECEILSSEELAFAILTLVNSYVQKDSTLFNNAIGALESAKQEFYRKHINPYEAQAEFEKGEIQ